MRILVTGGAGFIGSHLVRHLLKQDHQVSVLVKPSTNLWRLNDVMPSVSVLYSMEGSWDICFHMAWIGWSGVGSEDANLESMVAGISLLRGIDCKRIVLAGSCFQTLRLDMYGACKDALSSMAYFTRDKNIATARIFYTYGPMEDERRLVPSVSLSLLRRKPVQTTTGEQVRDYLHVEDVAAAIALIGASGDSGIVDVASGTPVMIRTLVRRLGDIAGRPDLIKFGALPYRPNEPMSLFGDASRLNSLGFVPKYTIESGLVQSYDWWAA